MNNQEMKAVEKLLTQLEESDLRNVQANNNLSKMSLVPQSQSDLNIVTQQLDLSQELDRLYHLINGHVIKREGNNEYWAEPYDDRLKVFSEYGAKQLMNYILFYINKNTLLSNFKIEEIDEKMYHFGVELCDLMYTMYEHIFYMPPVEKMYAQYLEIIRDKPDAFPHLILTDLEGNRFIDTDSLYSKCLEWARTELQMKIRHLPMIVIAITDSVHATMLRALNGEERNSLRKYMNIHQNINSNPIPEQKSGLLGGLLR